MAARLKAGWVTEEDLAPPVEEEEGETEASDEALAEGMAEEPAEGKILQSES